VGPCNVDKCGVASKEDCQLSEWTIWSECNARCGGGQHTREREVLNPVVDESKPCEGTLKETQGCNGHPCAHSVDCTWDKWTEWSACSNPCGGGNRNRYRRIAQLPKRNGKPCDPGASAEMETCNQTPCATIHYCQWNAWSSWTRCSTTCGQGQKKRARELHVSLNKGNDLLFAGTYDELDGLADQRIHVGKVGFVFMAGVLAASLILGAFSRRRARETID